LKKAFKFSYFTFGDLNQSQLIYSL